jgi:hypothetical protein
MYKILVIVKSEGGMDGGRAVTMETISFDSYAAAQKAYTNLVHNGMSGMTVIALF